MWYVNEWMIMIMWIVNHMISNAMHFNVEMLELQCWDVGTSMSRWWNFNVLDGCTVYVYTKQWQNQTLKSIAFVFKLFFSGFSVDRSKMSYRFAGRMEPVQCVHDKENQTEENIPDSGPVILWCEKLKFEVQERMRCCAYVQLCWNIPDNVWIW